MQSFGGNFYINMMLFEFFNIVGNLLSTSIGVKEKLYLMLVNVIIHTIFLFKSQTNQSPIFLIAMFMIKIS